MRYRAIIVLLLAAAVGTLLASFSGPSFKDRAQMPAERNLTEANIDAQTIELRQLAHSAMVRLQSR
jgi:hypothetical protein